MKTPKMGLFGCLAAALAVLALGAYAQQAQNANREPGPQISVDGYTYTQLQLFQRNIGAADDQSTQFPPHKIIGNVYYVGTTSLSSFLVVTPQGNILINTTYERNVLMIQKSVEQSDSNSRTSRFCWVVTLTGIIWRATRWSSS